MRILCPIIGGSGVEIYHQRLAAGLAAIGIETEIVKFSSRWEYFPWLLNWAKRLLIPSARQADVLHTNVDYGQHFRWDTLPWVVTLHHCSLDDEYATFISAISRVHHRFFLKPSVRNSLMNAHRVIAVSQHTRQVMNQVFQRELPIQVIYNGIDSEAYAPRHLVAAPRGSRIVLFFSGNPTVRKGFDLLAPVMRQLGKDFELYFTTGLREVHLKKELPSTMKCLGKLSETAMVEQINKADIVLQPSRREGFGYSILEGMACGKPVVSSNCSSIPELVESGKGGYLCEVGSVDQIVKAIQELAQSEDKRKLMGEYNRQRVLNRFSLRQMAQQYSSIYRELVGENHANRS